MAVVVSVVVTAAGKGRRDAWIGHYAAKDQRRSDGMARNEEEEGEEEE